MCFSLRTEKTVIKHRVGVILRKGQGSQQAKWVCDWAWVHMTQRRTDTGRDGAVGNMSIEYQIISPNSECLL